MIGIDFYDAVLEVVGGFTAFTSSKGGSPTGASLILGQNPGGGGTVWVSEATVVGDGVTVVGFGGNGTLIARNGGRIECESLAIARNATANGTATVNGTGSLLDLDRGAFIGGSSDSPGGIGRLNVLSQGIARVPSTLVIYGNGTVMVQNGTGTPGRVTVGNHLLSDPPGSGVVQVLENGTIKGTGWILGNLVASGGVVAPGLSAGQLNVSGNATLSANSTLAIEINGTAPGSTFDVLRCNGTFTFDGTHIAVTLGGPPPVSGQSYRIVDAASYAETNFTFSSSPLPSGLAWDTANLTTNGTILVTGTAVVSDVEILNVTRNGSHIDLTVNGTAGTKFVVQASTTLAPPASWSAITSQLTATGAPQIVTILDTFVTHPDRRFFRLEDQD